MPSIDRGMDKDGWPLWSALRLLALVLLLWPLGACGGSEDGESGDAPASVSQGEGEKKEGSAESKGRGGGPPGGRSGGRPGGGGPPGGSPWGGGEPAASKVPVEVTAAARRAIGSYFETQGTLEAENEVDLVARAAGPVTELRTEEGRKVSKGQVLATLDDRELAAQLEVTQVRLEETERNYRRVDALFQNQLVSQEALDQSLAEFQSAKADHERTRIQLGYTQITAPFSGRIVQRYVKLAEQVQVGTALFRLSDFDPLLCPIQVPERQLPGLSVGQRAELEVEAWPDRRFAARVLRVSPVVDAASGTVKVTLEVFGEGVLRPGMFAGVFLEMERREDALVIPKTALALDSLGDTVFVAVDGEAKRRNLELGFRSDDLLEVRSGLEAGEKVIVVGQDGLGEGTPVEVLGERPLPERGVEQPPPTTRAPRPSGDREASAGGGPPGGGPPGAGPSGGGGPPGAGPPGGGGPGGGPPGGGRGMFPSIDWDDPEQVERVKERMRERGLTDEQIEERLERIRQRMGGG